jgi:oxygen-independent coproporphyrinogen-3 oxidase
MLALGTSSLGEVDGSYVQNEYAIDRWRRAIDAGHFPIRWGYRLNEADRRRHQAVQHLLCNLEIPAHLAAGLGKDYECLARNAELGLVEVHDGGLKITPSGRYFLRSLCTEHEPTLAWSNNHWGVP